MADALENFSDCLTDYLQAMYSTKHTPRDLLVDRLVEITNRMEKKQEQLSDKDL